MPGAQVLCAQQGACQLYCLVDNSVHAPQECPTLKVEHHRRHSCLSAASAAFKPNTAGGLGPPA